MSNMLMKSAVLCTALAMPAAQATASPMAACIYCCTVEIIISCGGIVL
jgi:hypothetical protein